MNILTLAGAVSEASIWGGILAAGFAILAITLVFVVFIYIIMWKLFKKAGIEGWKCLIPYYNSIVLSQIATGKPTLGIISIALSLCTTAVNRSFLKMDNDSLSVILSEAFVGAAAIGAMIVYVILCVKLAQAYGGGTALCVCSVIFGYLALMVPAFDKTGRYRYVGPLADPYDDNNYAHYSSSGYGPGGYNNYNSYNNNYSNNNNNYGSVNNGNTYGSSTNNAGYSYPSPNNNNGQMDGIDTSSVNLNKDDNNNY